MTTTTIKQRTEEQPNYYTFACNPKSGIRECHFVSEAKADQREWVVQHHDAHECNKRCHEAVAKAYPIKDLEIHRPAVGIESVYVASRCEPRNYSFVVELKLNPDKSADIKGFEEGHLLWKLSKTGRTSTIRSNPKRSATKNMNDLHEWLSGLEFKRVHIDSILQLITCTSYAGSATQWSMKEAERAFRMPELNLRVKDIYRMAPCKAGVETQVTLYPDMHYREESDDHPDKYLVAFQQWRLLKYLANDGNRYHTLFVEGQLNDEPQYVPKEPFGHLPKTFEHLTNKQLEMLFFHGAVPLALQKGFVRDVKGTTSTSLDERVSNELERGQSQSRKNETKAQRQERETKLLFDEREAEAVNYIRDYLTVHTTHRILLVYGSNHVDFRRRFRDAGLSFCIVDPRKMERLPFR